VFLRSLSIRGFKSFADRTGLEFTPGVSVIVGPNGSGKSNIADAIAWVLGEQGPRALRGGQMADVIFAGSPGRPALGMAEVRMVIDNTAGLIPVPASEIEISRAVYRSGEGEYRLGGRPCRLLDIQELLSDTGIGRAMHTLIGQGHLEDVLAARPEDRRQFVEEAAGITKHRRRRERAERKLAGLDGDLGRIQDLVGEVRRQLRPLKQQAELAARHEALAAEAERLARALAAARLAELLRDRERHLPAWERAVAARSQARERLRSLDLTIASADGERSSADELATTAGAAHLDTLARKSEAEERLRAAIRSESGARERLGAAVNASGRLFALEEELERTERARNDTASTFAVRERELEEAEGAFRLAEHARRDAEDERRRQREDVAARRAEHETLQRALAGHEEELARLRRARGEVRARIEETTARALALESEIERLDTEAAPLATEHSDLEARRSALAAGLADARIQEQGLRARLDVLHARREELAESPAASFAKRRGDRPIGILADLVRCPPHLAEALRGALGPFADAVVYANGSEAIADAQADGARGVLLAIAEEAAPPEPPTGGRSVGSRLLDALSPDPRVADLVVSLLHETYLVRSLAEAAGLRGAHSSAQFVTPEGAVAGRSFVRAPAGPDRRLDDLARESGALEREVSAASRVIRETRQHLADLERRAEAVRVALDESDRRITRAAEELAGRRGELASATREDELLAEREEAARALAASVRASLSSSPEPPAEPPALPAHAEPPVHLRVEVEALRREHARLAAGAERASRDIAHVGEEDPTVLREAVQAAEAERAAAEESLRTAEASLREAADAAAATTATARAAQIRHAEANRAWREAALEVEGLREAHEEVDRARSDLERRIADSERVLIDAHGADPGQEVAALGADDTVSELRQQADVVQRRLGLLGKVNLLASGELGSIQERHDFLVREMEDVKAARRDLLEVIREVDRRMAELFVSAFEDVDREFRALFALLFPGGEGRLELTDPSDPLGSGIEVEARPGRKRVKRLSLLSGGERSLAALAFLFAIFKARPSPFYLMDEVEAALDDVNLHRFLDVVQGFAAASQILIVTHQKRTMEMADVLYGVSMGRDGASRVISQRLVEVASAVSR
jgi:chromosome segregation protein